MPSPSPLPSSTDPSGASVRRKPRAPGPWHRIASHRTDDDDDDDDVSSASSDDESSSSASSSGGGAPPWAAARRLCVQMELCGETLRRWLRETSRPKQRSSSSDDDATTPTDGGRPSRCAAAARRAARDVARGLAHIHARGYAHLDLASCNVFRRLPDGGLGGEDDDDETPWAIGDFGLARPADDASAAASCDPPDGHKLYVAPERWRRRSVDDLRRADLFSLGVLVYELGRDFTTDFERAVALGDLQRGRPTDPGVPGFVRPGSSPVLAKLLALDPHDRPTAAEVVQHLA
mmetsp:Transcript_24782/g.98391  ORF Transcript_24782/g.98391 Transcript_24782/m.98391 type:complete len:291 (+) Transcript_24782:858-1730(+)